MSTQRGQWHEHHLFPAFRGENNQKYRDFFSDLGIDIEEWKLTVDARTHLKWIHGDVDWNFTWKCWIDEHEGEVTRDEVIVFGKRMLETNGFYDIWEGSVEQVQKHFRERERQRNLSYSHIKVKLEDVIEALNQDDLRSIGDLQSELAQIKNTISESDLFRTEERELYGKVHQTLKIIDQKRAEHTPSKANGIVERTHRKEVQKRSINHMAVNVTQLKERLAELNLKLQQFNTNLHNDFLRLEIDWDKLDRAWDGYAANEFKGDWEATRNMFQQYLAIADRYVVFLSERIEALEELERRGG
jgi:hypothetical protein